VLRVSRDEWRRVAQDIAAGAGRLLALWTSGDEAPTLLVRAAYAAAPGLLVAELSLPDPDREYPGLEQTFPAAVRMQRAANDLTGTRSTDEDTRPWLRHAALARDVFVRCSTASHRGSRTRRRWIATTSSAWRATVCTRSRLARCMRE